ncbi:uncharacterized protein LOC103698541 [Phoenix dactylifera]|uniref:Uncharacterized protein LOC103698541 n=1 Tax=Phoenix dactylifera TaxID=42345 RepID=A0A8B8ZIM4_PHODC|nr:uncharacterized protein LOC103698541 [Phoenix dactylifera]
MGKRRFAQVSTSEDEDEPTGNDAGERRRGQKLRVEEGEERQNAAETSRGATAAGGSSSGGGGGGDGGSGKGEEEEETPLEDAKPKGPVLRVSGKGRRKKRHYRSFEYDGNTFELEDPVLLTPEDKRQKPYVAIIKDITQDVDGSMMVTGQWFYRPEEAEKRTGGSWEARDTRELFYSFHLDDVPAESVMHKCIVHFVPLNKKLPLRSEHPGFIVQKVYDTVERKLWKLTDKDYEDSKQHAIDLLVQKTVKRLGDLPDIEPEDAPADDADHSMSKRNLGKKRMHPIDVSRTDDAPPRSDYPTRSDTPGSCTQYRAILAKFKALTGDSYRDKWLDKLLQGIKAACSKVDASAEDERTGNGVSNHNTTGSNTEDAAVGSNSSGRICWPDDAVPAITALERATHETLASDFQKYNQKMRQLDFNLKNNVMLARRLLNNELDPVVILNMSPKELKDGLLAEEKTATEPEESKQLQMTDARCSRCMEKKVGIADIIQAGGQGDRYQLECTACGYMWYATRDAIASLTIDTAGVVGNVGTAPWATAKFEAVEKQLVSPRESEKPAPDLFKKTTAAYIPAFETQKSFNRSKTEEPAANRESSI